MRAARIRPIAASRRLTRSAIAAPRESFGGRRAAMLLIVTEVILKLVPKPELAQDLRKALIAAKHQLSADSSVDFRFPLRNGAVFAMPLTRTAFDDLIHPIVARTMAPVKAALADAHLTSAEIEEVVLVGGTTRTPLVRSTVQEYFGRTPHTELNPDEVVALGAAVQANILERGVSNMLLLDVTPLSLGIETYGGAVAKIIPRNSTIPASAQEQYTTGVDHQTGIEKAAERAAFGCHAVDRRQDDLVHHSGVHVRRHDRRRRIRAHAAGVRALVVVEQALVVLTGRER